MIDFPETKNFKVTQVENKVDIKIDCEGSSGNAFSRAVVDELNAILDVLPNDLEALYFSSAKSTFVVGADVNEIMAIAQGEDDAALAEFVRYGQTTFNRIEDLPFPTVALLNGTAMGGGLELALACDFRIAVDDDSVQFALPETKLGILPAWGGTTRLPRLIGADNAIEAICSAKSYRPRQALKLGLIDAVVQHQDQLGIDFNPTEVEKRRARKAGPLKLNMIEAMMVFKGARGMVSKAAGEHYPAPLKALDVIENARKMNRDDALELEVNAAVELGQLPVTENLISIFLKEQAVKAKNKKFAALSGCWGDGDETITVCGAGTMGADIAYLTANKGFKTYLYDAQPGKADEAIAEAKNYLMSKVKKNYISVDEMTEVLSRIVPVTEIPESTIYIEAIFENFDAKVDLISKLPPGIVVSNTSTILIDSLSKATDREVCGMHFFNPVKKMPLVEVIRGKSTSEMTVASVLGLALKLGKTPIVVNDCYGFVVNRLLFPYLVAFDSLVSEGWDFEKIDKVMKDWGWPMGPATLCDLVGIDVARKGGQIMCDAYGWDLNSEGPIVSLFDENKFGQKTGVGFYQWKEKRGKMVSSGANYVNGKDPAERFGSVVDSLMTPMIQQAHKIVDEGIVESWDEIDLAMIMGAGFPPYRGGLSKLK